MKKIFVGIDFGGTNVKIGLFDSDLKLLAKTSVETKADTGPESLIDRIGDATEKLLADNKLDRQAVQAVGMAAAGQFDLTAGIMISSPNMHSFKNVPLRKMLTDRIGKPAVIGNDANIACLGEFACGAGKDVEDMVFFTLGTGIGGGIVTNGTLVNGANDNAAELGHIIIYPDGRVCGCGQHGCAEAYASASSTAKRAAEAITAGAESSLESLLEEKSEITCKDVYEHLEAGDELAKKITDETAKVLALLCIDVLHGTDPQRIVFAGGMIAAGDILLDKIKEYFNKYIWSMKTETVEICFATLGEDAGLIGAAELARRSIVIPA